jgi:hypothetical protein
MINPRNVARRIINIKNSLPEVISEEGEDYSIDPSKINYSYKKGGQITKAQKGTKFNEYQKADQKTVDALNKYFESTPNENLIKS